MILMREIIKIKMQINLIRIQLNNNKNINRIKINKIIIMRVVVINKMMSIVMNNS